jgi:hypothetical protein
MTHQTARDARGNRIFHLKQILGIFIETLGPHRSPVPDAKHPNRDSHAIVHRLNTALQHGIRDDIGTSLKRVLSRQPGDTAHRPNGNIANVAEPGD